MSRPSAATVARTSYYDHPYVSNSKLTALKRELSGADLIEYPDAFRIGTLVDCMITEPGRIDYITRSIDAYQYTSDEINEARKMKRAFIADNFCAALLRASHMQQEFYIPAVIFNHSAGLSFDLDCRCKYDGYSFNTKWGWDLKTTTACSQAGFMEAVRRFDYDRQGYFYCKLSGSERFVLIGVSKVNYKVFIVTIAKGDDLWKSGEAKCNDLAFKYWSIKAGEPSTPTI